MTGPARGYKWRDAWPGNDLATKHGAHSERLVAPVAARLAAELAVDAPWTARPAHRAAVAAWARTEARLQLVAGWLDEHGDLDDDGRPRPATLLLDRLESRVARLRHELGISPLGHARLLQAVADVVRSRPAGVAGGPLDGVLADLMAEGRRALEASGRRLHPVGPGDGSTAAGVEAHVARGGPEEVD